MVSQHYGIIPALTCLQNLILGAEGGPIVDYKAAETRAQSLAERMGFQFNWREEAANLSPAGAQKLEILKLLWRDARIMILDEPTAMLSPSDSGALFDSLKRLASEGATVILVTHRLPEVMDYCSKVTVLRGGKLIDTKDVKDTTPQELATLIVGASLARAASYEPYVAPESMQPALDVQDLVVKGERGDDALKGVSLRVRPGELLGIAGVDGSGQRELFQSILGVAKVREGHISLGGQDATNTKPAERIRKGVRAIPEDRHAEAVIEEWSLEENSALGLQRMAPLAKGSIVDLSARASWAEKVAQRFGTKHGGLKLPMSSLSGGNQQRFVAGRALESEPKLILAFQPARGLDLKGTADVYAAVKERCREGAAAIVVSFDLDELLEHCDRIVAMNQGRIYEPAPAVAKDREAIGRLMVGAA
jgi:simple sugar transport system ATP-binding protein